MAAKELWKLIWLLLEDSLEAHYSNIKQYWSAHWKNIINFISEDGTHNKDYDIETTKCIEHMLMIRSKVMTLVIKHIFYKEYAIYDI